MKTYTTIDAAVELDVDVSRIRLLCRRKRLGYTLPQKNGWVITQAEIDTYRAIGPLRSGRKPAKPRIKRLTRVSETGQHEYE